MALPIFLLALLTPVILFVACRLGVLDARRHQVLQGLYCLCVAAAFIVFAIFYIAQTGGVFKPTDGAESVSAADSPFSFLVALAVLGFTLWVLIVGGWEQLRGGSKVPRRQVWRRGQVRDQVTALSNLRYVAARRVIEAHVGHPVPIDWVRDEVLGAARHRTDPELQALCTKLEQACSCTIVELAKSARNWSS